MHLQYVLPLLVLQQIIDVLYAKELAEKTPEHIVTDIYIFMLLYLEPTQRYRCRERIWYYNTDETGAHSCSEVQKNKNRRIK